MTSPFGLNFNMFNTGFSPDFDITSAGLNATNPINSVEISPFGGLDLQATPVDTFCANTMSEYAKMERDFFQILFSIMMNPNINHTPTPDIIGNFRPYNYNNYGKNADKISKLDPKMQEKTMQLLEYAKSQGMNVTITSGYRTQAEQQELLRTRPQYAAKKSLHCVGKAIDITIVGGKDEDYKKLGDYAKSIGMRWGGDFRKVKERWHFDLGNG